MPTWCIGVIDAVEKAGLSVEGVDLISSALVRAIGGQEASEQPEAIVSVGAGLTVVVIHQQGRPQFVRTVGAGGNATTAAISAALDLPINDAEAIKRRMGENSTQMQSASRAAMSSMQDVVSEIKNSVQYFASLPGRLPVGRVLVTGGGTDLVAFVPMLEEQVGLPVLRVSPLDRVDDSKLGLTDEQASEVGPVLASPIGLALPEPDKSVKKFNLIPAEVAHRMRLKRIQERTLLACAAVLVLLLGFGGMEALSSPQHREFRQRSPDQYRHSQRPGAQVRPGRGGEQRVHRRAVTSESGAELCHRLATCLEPAGRHHPDGRPGADRSPGRR